MPTNWSTPCMWRSAGYWGSKPSCTAGPVMMIRENKLPKGRNIYLEKEVAMLQLDEFR